MAQAKTLTPAELEQALQYIAQHSFALRNRVMLLTGTWSGMRVGEIASLSIGDVMNTDRTVKAEVRLAAEQTKGRHPRTVFLPQKLRDELQAPDGQCKFPRLWPPQTPPGKDSGIMTGRC